MATSFQIKNSFYTNDKITTYYLNQLPPDQSSTEKFTDDIFPPNENSLLSKDSKGNYIDKEIGAKNASLISSNEISWKRLSEIYPENFLFEDNIDLDDIRQGKIGNCYFLSSIAAMTEYPNLISQLFKTKSQNTQCYWEIILFIDGRFQIVVVDDYVPVIKNTNDLYFSKPNNKELWVVLLEKAWAKVNGGYANIISGWPADVFSCFTGYATSCVIINDESDQDEIYNKITAYDKGDCILCASVRGDDDKVEKVGLIKGHTYTLIGSYQVEMNNGDTVDLVKLRNPWGYREWNGAFSDGDDRWNNVKNKDNIGYSDKNDGSFFMKIEDFVRYFIRIDICNLIYDCNMILTEISKENLIHPNVYNLYVQNDNTNISISLLKEHWRYHRENSSSQYPSTLILMKYNEKDEKMNFVDFYGDYNSCDDCNIIINNLQKGIYIIFAYIAIEHCTEPKPSYAYLKVMSNSNYKLLYNANCKNYFELLNKMFICGVIQEEKENPLTKKEIFYDICNNFKNSGIGYRIIVNPQENVYQKWNNQTNEIINMFMLPPYENQPDFTFTVYPKSEVICLAMKNETYGSYWFNLKSSMKNYKTSTQMKNPNEGTFDIKEFITMIDMKVEELNTFSYDYLSISLSDAKYRKTYTKAEINQLMIDELSKREPKLMELLLQLEPLNDPEQKEDELVWVFVQKENGFYIGQAVDNFNTENATVNRYGRGAFKYGDDGVSFVGYWKNNNKEKKGTIYDKEYNIIFQGEYEGGKRNGNGELKFVNGDKYNGMFKDDNREGKGIYYWKDGSRWEGTFKDNVMNGVGMYYGNDGDNYEANYENGEYIE